MATSHITLFDNAQEVWFWFIKANKAKADGAQIKANEGLYVRPCEPSDILNILNRLYRHRRLTMDHFRVMRHYGMRGLAPDPYRYQEASAASLWDEAMTMLDDIFIAKEIVYPKLSATIIPIHHYQGGTHQWS